MMNVIQQVENYETQKSLHLEGAIRIRSLNWPVACPARDLDRTMGTKPGGEKTNSSDMSKDS